MWKSEVESQNHLGGKRPISSLSPIFDGSLPCQLDHSTKCHIQLFLEQLQGWEFCHLPGQSIFMQVRLIICNKINSRLLFFCTAVILQVALVCFLQRWDLLHSTILVGLKRHYLYYKLSPSYYLCIAMTATKSYMKQWRGPETKQIRHLPGGPHGNWKMDQGSMDFKLMQWFFSVGTIKTNN